MLETDLHFCVLILFLFPCVIVSFLIWSLNKKARESTEGARKIKSFFPKFDSGKKRYRRM